MKRILETNRLILRELNPNDAKSFYDLNSNPKSANACVRYGFEMLKLKRIIGRAMKENIGSIKVLEKIGLKYEKDTKFDGKEAVIYKIEK